MKYVDDRAGQTAASTYTMERYSVVDLLSFYKVNEHVRLNLDVKNLFNKGYDEGRSTPMCTRGAAHGAGWGCLHLLKMTGAAWRPCIRNACCRTASRTRCRRSVA